MQFPFPRYPFANNTSLEHTKKKKLLLRFHRFNKFIAQHLTFPSFKVFPWKHIQHPFKHFHENLILQSISSIATGLSKN